MNIVTHNEFCFIIWYYVPCAYNLYLSGKLNQTESKIGTSPLFYFSPKHIETNKHEWHFPYSENLYQHTNELNTFKNWTPPPYKEYFKNDILVYNKPILTVHNKITLEWERGLYNQFNIESLNLIFETFYKDFQIIYIRPPMSDTKYYQHDHNVKLQPIGDIELLNKYPDIISIEQLTSMYPHISYNELQMMALANSDKHITCAGGEAAIASYFGGDVLIYRHPTAISNTRGVWHTNSYLKYFSNANIIGFDNYNMLINYSIKKWK